MFFMFLFFGFFFSKKKLVFVEFFEKPKKSKKKIKKTQKNPGPWVSARGEGFWPLEALLSLILSACNLEILEPWTLRAGAPWIFLIVFGFFRSCLIQDRPGLFGRCLVLIITKIKYLFPLLKT